MYCSIKDSSSSSIRMRIVYYNLYASSVTQTFLGQLSIYLSMSINNIFVLRPVCTRTKSHDHGKLRALESHPKGVPWEIEIQCYNRCALELSVK